MPRRAEGLSAAKVKNAKPGRYGDGGGLYLLVRGKDQKFWLFRYTDKASGKLREMGLGPAVGPFAVPLAEARDTAEKQRALVRAGVDPIAAKKEARAKAARVVPDFGEAAKQYITLQAPGWTNPIQERSWRNTLATHAALLTEKRVSDIGDKEVSAVLTPIWAKIPVTAGRVRERIEAVLNYCKAQGWREGENPARWKGHLDQSLPGTRKIARVKHYAALPWKEVPAFMAELQAIDGTASCAFRFLILTATRTKETLGTRWPEIDLEDAVWSVPAERMKGRRPHRVPLSSAALDVLKAMLPFQKTQDGYVFPGMRSGAGLAGMTFLNMIERMGRPGLTAHGFRSSFRDWAGETTTHPREVCEAALAHMVGGAVEQSYARGDLFQKRRKLMQDWADFCSSKPAAVVSLADRLKA